MGGFILGGAALAGAASLLSGRRQNAAQTAAANKQMDFQETMSGSAHQREVRDLRKAGLNPILSATGGMGASTPPGAMPILTNPMATGISSGMEVLRTAQDARLKRAQAAVTRTENIFVCDMTPVF